MVMLMVMASFALVNSNTSSNGNPIHAGDTGNIVIGTSLPTLTLLLISFTNITTTIISFLYPIIY